MVFLRNVIFFVVLLATTFVQAMEEKESPELSPSGFHKISKLASLYVDTWNNFDPSTSPTVLTKIFEDSYTKEELEKLNDLKYSGFNCLPSFTLDWTEKAHILFLNKFLQLQNIEAITQPDIRKSLMLMAHDIGVARAVKTLPEREAILDQIKYTVGKLYLVMLQKESEEREVVGTGSGTFVQNERHNKTFVLSCAHFPISMNRYGNEYAFEMYFFPHYLLGEKNFPLGTEELKIPFDQYLDLKISGVIFPNDSQIKLWNSSQEKHEFLESDIPDIRVVKEGKKDFACFLENPRPEMLPMSFEGFSEHAKCQEFFAAGYPAWGLSDNTFAIVKGQPWAGGNKERHQAAFTFPTLHGMSGGPLFVWNDQEKKYILIAILTGVEENNFQSISYPLTGSDVDFLEDIK